MTSPSASASSCAFCASNAHIARTVVTASDASCCTFMGP
eukprot:CAMPEP_0179407818 /NCGR_PEP_ID=MMETSP0799-20121207/1732_1 /TAXON_ID=46947 /ORGANISM="Geminigera cryophila, Strain CCMP2564" /LENGTH=38 /DNA_ID= /DNA_START= /DNA_END= /DNA_ORIENTATION=